MFKHLLAALAFVAAGSLAAKGDAPTAVPSPHANLVISQPVAVTGAAAAPAPKPAGDPWAKYKHLTFAEAKALHGEKRVLFLDARAKTEWDQGHIPGALPMPLGEFDKYYDLYKAKIQKAKVLIPYCHGIGCHLSDKVADKLDSKGYKNVQVFFGGWPQWTQNNMPVEGGDGKVLPTPTPVTPAAAPAAK
jgi:rhodanese-related sulfurtransferase